VIGKEPRLLATVQGGSADFAQEAVFASLVAIELVVRKVAGLRSAPGLGSERFKGLGPAASAGRVAVRMEAGIQIGKGAPGAYELYCCERLKFVFEGEREVFFCGSAGGRDVNLGFHLDQDNQDV